MKPALSVFSL